MVHEVLAYEAFRALGCPRRGPATHTCASTAQDYGLYLERRDRSTRSRCRAGSTRPSTSTRASTGTDVRPRRAPDFEVDEGSESDRTDLEALIDAVERVPADWSERVAAVADLSR